MSDYAKSTNFTTKDTLPTGNSGKIVKGTELDIEFNAISSAIASKADISSPALLGIPTAPTATIGSNTTQIATTEFVKTAVGSAVQSITVTAPITSTGGTTPVVGLSTVPTKTGGTGLTSPTLNSLLAGNGPNNSLNLIAPGTAGNVLTSSSYTTASVTGSISTTTLSVTAVGSGTLQTGAKLTAQLGLVSPSYSSGGAVSQNQFVISSATGISTGMTVSGTGIPSGTTVSSIAGTTITISNTFTEQAAGTYNFYTPLSSNTSIVSQTNATGATAVTTQTYTSGGASSQATVVLTSVDGLLIGQFATGTGLSAGAYITSIVGTTVTFSSNFTTQAAGTYSFYNAGGIGTYVITPSQTAASTTITATLTAWSSASVTTPVSPIKAWVNFDGTASGTISPRASLNIASVVKNATGDYTITFTTALADANYVVSGSASSTGGGSGYANAVVTLASGTAQTSSAFRILTGYTGSAASNGANVDSGYVHLMVIR